jgi:hypothetical protein
MNGKRITAAIVAALVAGVVAGNVTSGFAATATTSGAATTTQSSMGLRLGGAMRDAGGRLADVVAKLTDQDVEAVQDKREAGASFADIAKSAGVSADKVVGGALDVRKNVLEGKVKDGTISQDQADAAVARMTDRLNDRVNATDDSCTGTGGGGRGQGGGMGGGRGRGGQGGGMGGACQAQ